MASIEMVDRLRSRAGVTYEEAREALDNSENDMLDALIWLEKSGKATPPRVSYYSTDSGDASESDAFGDMPYGKDERYYDADKMNQDRKAKKEKRREQTNKASKENKDNKTDKAYNANKADRNWRYDAPGRTNTGSSSGSSNSSSNRNRSSSAGVGGAYYYDERDRRNSHANRAGSKSFVKSAIDFISKAFRIGNTTMFEVKRYDKEIIKFPLTLLVVALFLFFQVVLILIPLGLFFGFRYNISGNNFNDSTINSVMDTTANAVDGIKEAIAKKSKEK